MKEQLKYYGSERTSLGQLDLQACALDRWAARRMVSPSCSACSSSSFVQYIVLLSSERKSSIPFFYPAPGRRIQVGNTLLQAIDSNIRGVIPFPRSSTQAAFLTCGARGENRAHEFLHLFLHPRPLGCSCGVARRCFLCPFVHSEVLAPAV